MFDNFLNKYYKVIWLIFVVSQVTMLVLYVGFSKHSINERLLMLIIAPAMFIAGIIVTSILLGLQAIIANIPKRTFLITCNSFLVSCLLGYIMLMIEFGTGSDKIAVFSSSAVASSLLTTIFMKNKYADQKT